MSCGSQLGKHSFDAMSGIVASHREDIINPQQYCSQCGANVNSLGEDIIGLFSWYFQFYTIQLKKNVTFGDQTTKQVFRNYFKFLQVAKSCSK